MPRKKSIYARGERPGNRHRLSYAMEAYCIVGEVETWFYGPLFSMGTQVKVSEPPKGFVWDKAVLSRAHRKPGERIVSNTNWEARVWLHFTGSTGRRDL